MRRRFPTIQWTDAEYLLRQIEFDIRAFQYGFSEDAKTKANQPKPLPIPGEVEEQTEKLESAMEKRAHVAGILGIPMMSEGGEQA